MKSKKRDRSVSDEPKPPPEPVQTERELLLKAFEKPTQIYRFLVPRHACMPIFLNRTASYMSGRCKRKANTRKSFEVDSLLAKVEAAFLLQKANSYKQEYLNLTFMGFYDKDNSDVRSVDIEVSLVKICHSKRKDISSPETEISIGKVTLPCNPTCLEMLASEIISISSDNFCANGTHVVKSYKLHIVVTNSRKLNAGTTPRPGTRSRDSNGSDLENQDPPPKKRLRRSSEERPTREGRSREEKMKGQSGVISYQTELTIYDKYRRCLLTDGEYELALEETATAASNSSPNNGKNSSWHAVSEGKAVLITDIFGKRPVLKFTLCWKPAPVQNLPSLIQSTSCDEIICNNRIGGRVFDFQAAARATKVDSASSVKRQKRVFYQFLLNNARQQTEVYDEFRCPWCGVNCMRLQSLLTHLRCCHARFNFSYVEHPNGARIDVTINECYDGSYVGNPQDLHSHVGYAFGRNGPVRRMPVTIVIVYRSKKLTSGAKELHHAESESSTNRQLVHGHNRLYFHSSTCQPIRPCEIDMDSEDENDPEWLRQKTQHMIDEFTDVNEGEKDFMKLWNLHVMHNNYIGDCQLTVACEAFVKEYGSEIYQKNLGRNFLLHLVNLCDFSLIRPEIVYRIAIQFFRLRRQLEDSSVKGEPVASSSS